MINKMTIEPNQVKKEGRMLVKSKDILPYTGAYVGAYSYCYDLQINCGVEFAVDSGKAINYNVQIGKYNSIALNLSILLGRNHNIRAVESGALSLMFQMRNCFVEKSGQFNQKGSVIIQNDVWIGEGVKIMPNTIVRNGAVIATNSHVVSDVPPYAIVGGNPAKVIGYRFPKDIITKLQIIRWWDWNEEKLLENASLFTEDVEGFCEKFYQEENEKFISHCNQRNLISQNEDVWFAFVDYYENYANYSFILESFLDAFMKDGEKRLVLFVQDMDGEEIEEDIFMNIRNIIDEIARTPDICCTISLERGNFEKAEKKFMECQHYLVSRTYWAVHFSCLADLYGIEIVSGVDSRIQFFKSKNMLSVEEAES